MNDRMKLRLISQFTSHPAHFMFRHHHNTLAESFTESFIFELMSYSTVFMQNVWWVMGEGGIMYSYVGAYPREKRFHYT